MIATLTSIPIGFKIYSSIKMNSEQQYSITMLKTYPEASLSGCLLDTVQEDAAGSFQLSHTSSGHGARRIQEENRVQRHLTTLFLFKSAAQGIFYTLRELDE